MSVLCRLIARIGHVDPEAIAEAEAKLARVDAELEAQEARLRQSRALAIINETAAERLVSALARDRRRPR